jgi:malate dehydrogenase (oxaloacetate-decarboxylating)
MIGMGAANVSGYRLLKAYGVDPAQIVACDRQGTLHHKRQDIEARRLDFPEKWSVCQETNRKALTGGIAEALRGADVCIAFSSSGPGVIEPAWVRSMANDAIVFPCANPNPEIWPWDAKEAGARIVATGRSDFTNQLNNSPVFPGVLRGTLDSRAATISDEMALAAAIELAACAEEHGLSEETILPTMADWQVVPRVAAATAMKAQESSPQRDLLQRVSHRTSRGPSDRRTDHGTRVDRRSQERCFASQSNSATYDQGDTAAERR